jgi:hypothetical protein
MGMDGRSFRKRLLKRPEGATPASLTMALGISILVYVVAYEGVLR